MRIRKVKNPRGFQNDSTELMSDNLSELTHGKSQLIIPVKYLPYQTK